MAICEHNNTKQFNEVVKCLHIIIMNTFKVKWKRPHTIFLQESEEK